MSLDCKDDIQAWMHQRSGLPIQEKFYGIARRVDGRIVAAFGFDSFQEAGCALHLCVDSPTGITRSLLHAVFRTAFVQWEYSYLVAIIQESNFKSLRMADKLGFTECGRIPTQLWFGVLYRDQCKWIDLDRSFPCQAAPRFLMLRT